MHSYQYNGLRFECLLALMKASVYFVETLAKYVIDTSALQIWGFDYCYGDHND